MDYGLLNALGMTGLAIFGLWVYRISVKKKLPASESNQQKEKRQNPD